MSRMSIRTCEPGRWSAIARATLGLVLGLAVAPPCAGEDGLAGGVRQRLAQAACDFLEGAVTVPYDSVAVALDLPALPDGGVGIADYRFELLSSKSPAGSVGLRITLFRADGSALPLLATARVRIYDRVCVATRRLDRHESLAAEGLRIERREVTSLADGYYGDTARITGKRTKRIIPVGSIIQASDIQEVPLVARGSGVVVSVVIGAVTVVSKAKALEDGELGQVITVEHLATRKHLTGTVAGRGLVVLEG
jgi:flagella basal body P-ring formation protein FlgA